MSDSKHAKKQRRSIQHGKTNNDPSLAAAPAQQQGKRHSGHGKRKAAAHSITFETIEPRILLSADPLGMALPVATASYTTSDWTDSTPLVALSQDLPPVPILAASKPVDGSAAEDEPLLTALSAVPATQSQISVSNVEVTLDPDGRVQAGSNIFITVKNTLDSTFYGQVWAQLQLSNNEDGTGPRQDLLDSEYSWRINPGFSFPVVDNIIPLRKTLINGVVVDISDNSGRVSLLPQQEVVFLYQPNSQERINKDVVKNASEVGNPGVLFEPGTAYLQTTVVSNNDYNRNGRPQFSSTVASSALNTSFADLQIIDIGIPDRLVVGEDADFAITVLNRGNINANFNNQPFSANATLKFAGNFIPELGNRYNRERSLHLLGNTSNGSVVNIAPGASHTFMIRFKFDFRGDGFINGYGSVDDRGYLESIDWFEFDMNVQPAALGGNSAVDMFQQGNKIRKTGNVALTPVARPDLQLEVENFTVMGGGSSWPSINFKITNIGDAPIVNQYLTIPFSFQYNGYSFETRWSTDRYTTTQTILPGQVIYATHSFNFRNSFNSVGNIDAAIPVNFKLEGNYGDKLIEKKVLNNRPTATMTLTSQVDFTPQSYAYDDELWSKRLNLFAGDSVSAQWKVNTTQNKGTHQSREDSFYWSKDYYWNGNATLAAKVTSTIPAGSNSTVVTVGNLVLPKAGYWYLFFKPDSSNSIAEALEDNNVPWPPPGFTIKPRGPDLTIGTVTAPSSAIAGNPLEVKWESRNVGDTAVSAPRMERVVLRKGGQKFEYDVTYTDTIEPGKFKDRTLSITPPVTLAGTWEVSVIADPLNAINEPSWGNSNNEAPAPAQVNIQGSDLTIGTVTAASTVIAGERLDVSWDARNLGVAAVSGSRTERVVLRKEGQQSIIYDFPYNDVLQPNESKDRTQSILIPATLAGTWEISVIVDPENAIMENGETNNEAPSPKQVNIQGSDLTIGTVTAASTVIAGELLEVSWDARNLGVAAVSGSRTERVVLRKEGQQSITFDFTYDDLLQPGASKSRTQSILIPATLSGVWEVSVIVDPLNAIMEQVETNNEAPVPKQVTIAAGRNLVVSDVQGPSMAIAAQTVQVDWRVRNTGGGAATQGWKDRIYLSQNATLTSDDTLLKTVSNQSTLAAGAEYAASAWVQLPDNIAQNFRILVVTDLDGAIAEAVETDNITASEQFLMTDTPPQLVASALITPPSMLSNVPTAISWTVTNSGSGPVANVSWTDSIFISADAFFDSGDERVADFTYQGPLAKDAAVTRYENITLPQGRAGSFYFFVFTDSRNQIYEYGAEEDNRTFRRDGNNQIAPVDVFATNPPDLEVEALGLSTSTALSGQVISVEATIANNGADALAQNAAWTDQFYLSFDTTLDAHDTTLDAQDISLGGQRRESGLAVGVSYKVKLDVSLGDLGSGTYYVIAVADQGKETLDFDRVNNIRVSAPLAIQRLPADLQASNVQAPAFLVADEPSEVTYVVSNTGTGKTTRDSWTDYLWISRNDVLGDADDMRVGSFQHSAPLAAGQSRSVTATITPPLTAEGPYRLFVMTDATSAVPEYSGPGYGGDTNNVATGPVTTVFRSLADLVVTSLDALDTVRPGQVVSVAWQVKNQGDETTNVGAWKDAFFISTTGQIDTTALRLNVVQREGVLAPGQSYTGSAELEIPPDLPPGNYALIVMADWPEYAGGYVLEGVNESNNTFSRSLTLAGAPMRPDLQVSDFLSPSDGIGGLPVTLSWTVKNTGDAIAKPGWYDRVYLSLDDAINKDTDKLLGAVKREAPLNPGQTDQVSATFTLPLGLNGDYQVIVHVGADGLPNETAKADNLIWRTISLIPEARVDLRVVSTTAPISAAFNEATSIAYTVVNDGPHNIAARVWHDRVFLSTDDVLDSGDTELATVRQDRALDAGASYTAQVTAPLQGITPGTYYVIVEADAAKALQETNETNNVLAAEPPLEATMPSLGYGATVTASLPKSGAMLYYRLDVPAGEAFRVTLDGAGTGGAAALYTALNRIPKPGNADYSGVVGYTLDQTIIVPKTVAGTYFIAVRGEALPQDTPFTLSIQKMDFAVTATSVEVLGNAGQATLRIQGALFDASTRFFLKGPGGIALEGSVRQLDNAGEAVATFFLEDAPVGSYSLVALKDSLVTTFAKSIQVKEGFAGTAVADFNGPGALLNGSSSVVGFGYSNAGGTDLMAPLYILTDKRGGSIGSSIDDAEVRPMQILGASLQGNPILLEPGAAFTYRFFVKDVSAATGIEVSAKAVTSADERSIGALDWVELKDTLRPEELSWEEWTTFWNRIRPQLGTTWGEYVSNVNGMMVALTTADEPPVRDVRELFRRLEKIGGNVTPDVSGRLVDSVTGQPVVGVEISLQGINDAGASFVAGTGITDANGGFVIPKVGWGLYTIVTDKSFDLNGDGTADSSPILTVMPGSNFSIVDPIRVAPETEEAASDPDIGGIRFATDASGLLHGVWIDGTDIIYATYDGTSWSPATVIASAGVVTELHINFSPKLLDDTIPALLVTWIGERSSAATFANQLNEREVFALVGRLGPGTNVVWSDAFAVTNDAVRDRGLSVQILSDGDALLSFLKEDWSADDDSDVYYTRLDLFSVNLPWLNSLSASSVTITQPVPPEREDFLLNRGNYEITDFDPVEGELFEQVKFGWSTTAKKWPETLTWLPGANKNEIKLDFGVDVAEKSTFAVTSELQQYMLRVKKQGGQDVFGRLTQKDVSISHKFQAALNFGGTVEAKVNGRKIKFDGGLGLSVDAKAPIGFSEWKPGTFKVKGGFGVSYTAPDGLIDFADALGTVPWIGLPFKGAAYVMRGFDSTMEMLGFDSDFGVTFGGAVSWDAKFKNFGDVLQFNPKEISNEVSFFGSGYQQLKHGKWGKSGLQEEFKSKLSFEMGLSGPWQAGEIGWFWAAKAKVEFGWFNWSESTGGGNIPAWDLSRLIGSSTGFYPAPASSAITPDVDLVLNYLQKDPTSTIGTGNVYAGQSLVSNVAGDLFKDGAPSLTALDDGRVLAVWTKDSTEFGNRLYSAIYDGATWSQPTAIAGTYGLNSDVVAVKGLDGRVSIVWTQADPSSLESVTQATVESINNVLRAKKILHMVFNGSGFSAPSEITRPTGKIGALDAIVQPDGSTLLSWVVSQFDQNNNRSDSVYQSSWNGAQWSAPGLVVSNVAVQALQLQAIGGNAHLFWTGSRTAGDDKTSQIFVQRLNAGTWSAAENFAPSSPRATISPSGGNEAGTGLTASTAQPTLLDSLEVLDVPPWPAINIDDFYNVAKDKSLSGENLLRNDGGTAEEKSNMRVEKVNGQGPGSFTVTSKGGRQATINVSENGILSFTPGAAFQNLLRNQVDVVRFLYVINDVGSRYEGELLTEDLRTSVVEIKVFGEDPPPEPPEPTEPPGPPPTELGPYNPFIFISVDPNDILGPVGHGPENWINATTPLGYTIRFENIANATAPAKKVVITQTLDTDLDARSLRFGDIGFGDIVLDVPEGASYISQRLDLQDKRGVYVDVLATVDITTRTAMWIFTAIDPVTGDIPQDGSVGFLPPNVEVGEGEGFVNYQISVRNEAQNGARIDAVARIVFDNEAPLDTPSIFNTIDRASPTSAVALAGEVTGGGAISLTWAGTDGITGSGIASYTILVAKDGGPFAVWLEDTATTTAVFNGEPGSSYAFYSIARDHSGLLEAAPATPDVSLIVPGIAQGAVAGTVFDDLNQNGSRESGESVLAGATVFLDADGDGLLDPGELSTTTGAAGGFNLAGVRSGAYDLRVVGSNEMVLATRNLSIWSGRQLSNLNVDAFTPGRIGGVVFDDIDGDGLQEAGESALSGAVVFLDDNGNGLKDANESAVTTGADGAFVFAGLSAGPRKLVLDAANGRVPTGSSTRSTTVTSGLDLKVNFGTVVPGKIEGILFEDANGDGVRNGTERSLSGWAVFLDGNGNGVRDAGEAQITTGMTGSYSFTGLKPGSYTVSASRPSGWLQTSDPSTTLGTVQVQSASASALGATAAGKGAAAALTGLSALQSDPAFSGITGAGIGIVVVDSGIDADHPFFGPDVDGNGVADRIIAQYDFVDNDTNADDTFGHGTHIAGIIASQDAAFGGVAPKANVIALRALNSTGSGSFSRLEAALQWTLTNADKYNIRVVNLSMGDNKGWDISTSLYGIGDELAALASRDILVIAAAGNGFYTFNSKPGVSYPAADPNVVAVGAVWATEDKSFSAVGAIDFTTAPDRIAAMSQRHAGLVDVFAPGMQIVSAGIGGGTSVLSGTSQAAGFTSGVAALAQQIALDKLGRPLKVSEFIDLLSSTSRAILDGDDENDNVTNTSMAYPRLDVLALAQAIAKLSPGSAGATVTSAALPASMQVAAPGSISVSPGSNILAPIGLFGSFSVGGAIFLDANKNGVYDTGEAMLAGANLVIDMDGTGTFSAADRVVVTGSDGGFQLAGLGSGPKLVGVKTDDDQMIWVSALSSTSRVNISGLQLAFQPIETVVSGDGGTDANTGVNSLPGVISRSDPWLGIEPLKTPSAKTTPVADPLNRSPIATTDFGATRKAEVLVTPVSENQTSIAAEPQREGSSAAALPPASDDRFGDPPTISFSNPAKSASGTTKAAPHEMSQSQLGQPQSRQGDNQVFSAIRSLSDTRRALDSAKTSLGAMLPAQEARSLLLAATSGPTIMLDEEVLDHVLAPAANPERHTRGGWVSDFLTDAGKVIQGPGDELVVLAAGAATLQGSGRRHASGRETPRQRNAA